MSKVRQGMVRGLLAAVAGASFAAAALASDSVTFVGWGGNGQEQMRIHWTDPFTAATGIPVVQDGPTDYGKIKAMVEAGNVSWDVVSVEGGYAAKFAAEGLLEPLDFSLIDTSDVNPVYVTDYGVGTYTWSWVIAYNETELGGQEPQGWADFFDTDKLPGARSITKWIAPGMLEAALVADGVPPDQLYPLDVERALAKFDSIKDDIVWWNSAAESQQHVTSGEAAMGMQWSGRAVLAAREENVGVTWAQNLVTADFVVVPKGSKNKDAAMKLINQIATAESQLGYAVAMRYGPVSQALLDRVAPESADEMPAAHTETQIQVDLDWWAQNLDAVSERWYAWQTE